MKRQKRPVTSLRVEEHPDEPMVFSVESQEHDLTDPNWQNDPSHPPYRVELEAGRIARRDGRVIYNGTCTCPGFYPGRRHKDVRAGIVSRCPHIQAAVLHIYDRLMTVYVRNRNARAGRTISTVHE